MAPSPQEASPQAEVVDLPNMDSENIVISGMSGVYPQTHSVDELCKILYNKVNPITDLNLRFKFNHPEVVQYGGSVPDLHYFDAQFFKVHYRLSQCMDPMGRIILEHAYQAIYDAGVNPVHLSGKKIGVYIGTCFSETEKTCFYDEASRSGFGIAGCSKTMFANRVSYWLNAKGPSLSIDEACCSSTAALEQAFLAINRGECEAAIVGGAYLCLHPQSAVHYGRLMKLCKDGKTKSFDENADGCAKAEAITVLFLQKAKDAMRVYAQVVHAKSEYTGILSDETGPVFGFERKLEPSVKFVKKFYEEAKIPPQAVEYVEAFGCAVPEADKTELETIDKVYCNDRKAPLLVGSVLSNIGYNEAASGLSGVTKVLLGYHTGRIAANLHCTKPRQDVLALKEGRMRIVTDHVPFSRQYTAINGLSVTGLNTHVLLHGQYRPKDLSRYKSTIPYLVTVSGRHEEAVAYVLANLKSQPIDPEQLRLLNNIHQTSIAGHLGRGYTILKTDEEQKTVCLSEKSVYFDNAAKPLWFVYSGMGSQWAGMGTELMRIPIFAAAIERCHRVLEPKGIDIVNIITSRDEKMFDNILHSFVGIAAIQIGLTDVLHAVGLTPDGIIGHSVGELGCAYADGCLTAEEMILSAYCRGLVSLETPFIRGSMAAIGLGYQEIVTMCPPEIEVACHNGPESSTISGPADKMREFVAELTAKGIFAKEVPCSNIAYHSRYIAEAGPQLHKYLSEVITSPKPRTKRWLSSSVPQSKWYTPDAQLCSAQYHTNNLLSPVLFEETSRLIPDNAVLVEVAPHGLLQAILKRSLPSTCINIPLTRRKHPDNSYLVLESIGKLFMEGYNPKLHVLYPEIELPVSTGTPFLSHLVKWAHGESWHLALYRTANRVTAASCDHCISWHDTESAYLKGHSIRGRTIFPFAATLVLVWDTLAMILSLPKKLPSVKFSHLHLHAQPIIHDERQLKINVTLCRGTGAFEVLCENTKVATGFINVLEKEKTDDKSSEILSFDLNAEDIYKSLQDRDYSYNGEFQSIVTANESFSAALLSWNNNWVTLIDGLLQLHVLREPHTAVSVPSRIRTLIIDVPKHEESIKSANTGDKVLLKAEVVEELNVTRCGGLSLINVMFENLPPVVNRQMSLQALKFVPNTQSVKNETWGSEHYVSVSDSATVSKNVTLQSSKIGDLDSLTWVEAPENTEAGVDVTVHYAGINQADVRKVNGSISDIHDTKNRYGMDFSGVTKSGQRVMGLVPYGAASSVVRAQPDLLWPVPASWSLEDAATVPLAYAQAFYCLTVKSYIRPESTILVHGGSGAFGQAVLSIALAYGCKVFTTVSDTHKKRFLLKLFPQLKAEHIGYSRNASFKDIVKNNTDGFGCDIVINTIGGSLKNVSIDCVGSRGVFVDNSQILEQEEFSYGMFHLTRERNYRTTDFLSIFNEENAKDRIALKNTIINGITNGLVRPLSRVTYAPHEVSRAFRLIAGSKHRGKVLLNMTDSTVQVQPRITASADGSHLILCNDDTFGLQLADRLVERGAKKLCIHFKRQSMLYLQLKIRSWQRSGVRVVVFSDDLKGEMDITALLSTAARLGPLEGVYVTVGNQQHEALVNSLDLMTRKLRSAVKYFAVLNIGGGTIGINACLKRAQDKLPVTLLTLPELGIEAGSYRSAVDAAERALRNGHPVQRATLLPVQQTSLLQEIASIAKISMPPQAADVLTLEDLGLESDRISSIIYFLRTEYNLFFEPEQVPLLTIETINNLSKILTPTKRENVEGLSNYYSYVDSDELLATTELVFLPTLTCSASMRDDEFNTDQAFLCLVPGIEGHNNKFKVLCERLKLTALVLQPGLDKPNETVRETAERYAEALLKKTGLQQTFYLLGYESGVSVALEVASILEDHGHTGVIYCIGYSPEGFTKLLQKKLSKYETREQLEDAVARHMFTLMANGDTTGLEKALQGATTWSQKVDACVRTLLGRVSHSAQYARTLIEAAFVRIEKAKEYVPTVRALRSQLVQLLPMVGGEEALAYSLQQHSQQPLIVHELQVPLAQATYDLRCTAIINSYLDKKILDDYEKKNTCITYLLGSDSYMSLKDNA